MPDEAGIALCRCTGHRAENRWILAVMTETGDPDQPMTISVWLSIAGPPAEGLADQLREVWGLAAPEDPESDGGILIGEGETELAGMRCVIRIETLSDGVTVVYLRGSTPIDFDLWQEAEQVAAPVRDAAVGRLVPTVVAADAVTVTFSDLALFPGEDL